MEFCPGDLQQISEFGSRIRFRADEGLPSLGVVETITITKKLGPGQLTPAIIAGTGYLKKRKFPDHKNGELQEGGITIKWDGKTGPAFTPATTS